MKHSTRWIAAVGFVTLLGWSCDEPFMVDPEQGIEVAVEAYAWPDTLIAGQGADLVVDVLIQPTGERLATPPIEWSVEPQDLGAFTSAETDGATALEARRPGTATITAELSEDSNLAGTTLRGQVEILLTGVAILDDLRDTVATSVGDTIVVEARGLGHESAAIERAGLMWTRGGTGAVALTPLAAGDGARVVTLANGADTLVVTGHCGPVACADTAVIEVRQVAANVTASADTLLFSALGGTRALSAAVSDARGNGVAAADVVWTLADPADSTVVGLSTDGSVTARGNGTAGVVATAGAVADTVAVTVEQVIAALALHPASLDLDGPGAGGTVTASLADANGNAMSTPGAVTWTSRNEGIATVGGTTSSADADVTAVAFGTTYVLAESDGFQDSARVDVTPDSVRITPVADTVAALGHTVSFGLTAFHAGGTVTAAGQWTSSDPTIASVDRNGTTTAIANGEAGVIGSVGAVADTAALVVRQAVASVEVAAPSTAMAVGDSVAVSASAADAGGAAVSDAAFAWSSSAPAVATVEDRGDGTAVVRAGAAGSATITATADGVAGGLAFSVRAFTPEACNDGGIDHTSTIEADETWAAADGPHRVPSTLTANGAALTIEAGALVCLGSGARLILNNGGHLQAQGTDSEPIGFIGLDDAGWGGLNFQGTPSDTSRLVHVVVEGAAGSYHALNSVSTHRVRATDVAVRDVEKAVSLSAPESRLQRTLVEGVSGSSAAVYVSGARSVIDSLTVRNTAGPGVQIVADSAVLRDVSVVDVAGEGVILSRAGVTIEGLRVDGAAGYGLDISQRPTELRGVRVLNGTGYPARLAIEDLLLLAPTREEQDSLRGNGRDTIVVRGGSVKGRTDIDGNWIDTLAVTMRSDLPWLLESTTTFDSASVLTVEPGTTVRLGSRASLRVSNGLLRAVGTAAQPIRFTAADPGTPWGGLELTGAPGDTSRLTHVELSWGAAASSDAAVEGHAEHPVAVDEASFRRMANRAINLLAPGSSVRNTSVDSAMTIGASGEAIRIGEGGVLEDVVVRRSGAGGIRVAGSSARLERVRIVDVDGRGLEVYGDSATLIDVRVDGAMSTGLYASGSDPLAAASGVRVVNGGGYPAQLGIQNLHLIAPTRAAQDSLLGNALDTLLIHGGRLKGVTDIDGNWLDTVHVTARSDLPWRVVSSLTIDSAAILTVDPGAIIRFGQSTALSVNSGLLDAVGTASEPILMTASVIGQPWYGITVQGDPGDTSRVSHAEISWGGATSRDMVLASGSHPLILDEVHLRRSYNTAVDLGAPGSAIRNARVDTVSTAGAYPAVDLGADTEALNVTLRGAGEDGIHVTGARARLENIDILDPVGFGLRVTGDSAVLAGVRIDGAGGTGIHARGSYPFASATGIRVTNGRGYPAELGINNLLAIAPTPADQDSLLGSALDTLIINGGSIKGRTDIDGNWIDTVRMTVRADLPWIVSGTISVDTAAILTVEPGTRLIMEESVSFTFRSGLLSAVGTVADPILFTSTAPGVHWGRLSFSGSPGDTSRIKLAEISWANGNSYGSSGAVDTQDTHPVLMDSVSVRRSAARAVAFRSPGSALRNSTVDTVYGGWGGVNLRDATSVIGTRIRGSEATGILIEGSGVTITDTEITGSAGDGIEIPNNSSHLTGLTLTNLNLFGNAGLGINNTSGSLLTAEDLWWGDGGGPTGAGGDGVSANVDFDPWASSAFAIPAWKP